MKTKLSAKKIRLFILFLALCPAPLALCQIPQGFNYQAIARNSNGVPITSQAIPVRISILTALTGGTVIWQEEHPSVIADQYGMISLVVGAGTKSGGSAASFAAIDWSAQTLFLKTEVKYPGTSWTDMGTSQIWAVPYSMVAKSIAPLSKLGITGTTTDMEEALFEVRNKAGNIVFAVYNEGIRAYVGNGDVKGARGGFSVGGYDATKGAPFDLFVLNTDSARFYIDSKPNLKGKKGGFSVGGYDMSKTGYPVHDYLDVSKDSVRIYVDSNPLTKGKKGGFSVGGYDMTKGGIPAQDYMHVSKDSVRVYIDSNPLTKGKRGGFAVGGYDLTKGINTNYMNVNTDATGIINPSQNRILWYPIKNAFLTGKVLIESPDSVGTNSFASGYESKARGIYSQALGFKSIARGSYSTAIGKNAVANKINSFAFGEGAYAGNSESYALGRGATASGYRSFALGSAGIDDHGKPTGVTRAIGDYSFAIGQGSQSYGYGSFAIGLADTTRNSYSVAMGYKNSSTGGYSFAMGVGSIASGDVSVAMGNYSIANDHYSVSIGDGTISSGVASTAMGYATTASGDLSVAMGVNTKASGYISTAMGNYTTAKAYSSFVIGEFNDTTCSSTGEHTWVSTDPLFIIGNGSWINARSNAFTVLKNGKTAIGHAAPTQMLDVNGNARFRSVSSGTFGNNLNIMADGTLTTATSDISMKENINQISDALDRVMKLRGVFFNWNNDSEKRRQIGMIAQEVEPVVPEIVFTNPVDGLKGINYSQASALLVEAIKEQQKQILGQQSQISAQNDQIESQQKEIDDLKTLVNSLIANQTAQVNK